MKIGVFYLRVICTCDQCDSPFIALQLTALIFNPIDVFYCIAVLVCIVATSPVGTIRSCIDCVIHHEWDVREEKHCMNVTRTSNNRVIIKCEL